MENNINSRLKHLRVYLGKTQNEFAVMLNITQANISQLEHSISKPSAELIEKIHDAFPDLNFNWLLNGTSPIFLNKGTVKNSEKDRERDIEEIFSTEKLGIVNYKTENNVESLKKENMKLEKMVETMNDYIKVLSNTNEFLMSIVKKENKGVSKEERIQ